MKNNASAGKYWKKKRGGPEVHKYGNIFMHNELNICRYNLYYLKKKKQLLSFSLKKWPAWQINIKLSSVWNFAQICLDSRLMG